MLRAQQHIGYVYPLETAHRKNSPKIFLLNPYIFLGNELKVLINYNSFRFLNQLEYSEFKPITTLLLKLSTIGA